jgi:hypothetical protein
VPELKLAAQYADMSHDALLALLETLLAEQESYSEQILKLTTEVAVQRVEGWNSGYRWGWRDCRRRGLLQPQTY